MDFRGTRVDRPALTAAGILGGMFYCIRFGFGLLNPGRIDWLLGMTDTAFSQLSWTFYRCDAWHWPPGAVKTFMAPGGTTIGLTDSLPLLAIPLKLISTLLPDPFQYAGFWLLVSHVLMAAFAWKVAVTLVRRPIPRALAAGVLVLCPAWLIRDGHIALSAHWVYLAALSLYVNPPAKDGDRPWLRWWMLLAVTALIHPYPATICLLFLAADQGRRLFVTREESWRSALVLAGGGVAVVVALWYLAGFLNVGRLPVSNLPEHALWSASPHALWDGQGRALLTPAWPLGDHEPFEGFVYLGLGGLMAVVAALVLSGRRLGAGLVRHWPLVLVLLLCAVYAFGPRTDLSDRLYRAQARFLWPHYYVLVAAGLAAVARWERPRWPTVLLAAIFVVQTVDLYPLLERRTAYDARTFVSRLQDPQWVPAITGAHLLLTTPSPTASTVFEDDFVDLTLFAHENGVPTTAGFATRSFEDDIGAAEALIKTFLFGGRPQPGTVGVIRRSHFAELFPGVSDNLRCTDLDGFPVCFARNGGFVPDREFLVEPVTLAGFLAANLDRTVIMVGKGDARNALTVDAVRLLSGAGSNIGRLPVGASYASVFVNGEPVFEQMNRRSAIQLAVDRNTDLGGRGLTKELKLTSSGTSSGEYASLLVDGREVVFNSPGLNVAVLDNGQNVLTVGNFAHPDRLPALASTTGGLMFTLVHAGDAGLDAGRVRDSR